MVSSVFYFISLLKRVNMFNVSEALCILSDPIHTLTQRQTHLTGVSDLVKESWMEDPSEAEVKSIPHLGATRLDDRGSR